VKDDKDTSEIIDLLRDGPRAIYGGIRPKGRSKKAAAEGQPAGGHSAAEESAKTGRKEAEEAERDPNVS
jgi:hypothetical protein